MVEIWLITTLVGFAGGSAFPIIKNLEHGHKIYRPKPRGAEYDVPTPRHKNRLLAKLETELDPNWTFTPRPPTPRPQSVDDVEPDQAVVRGRSIAPTHNELVKNPTEYQFQAPLNHPGKWNIRVHTPLKSRYEEQLTARPVSSRSYIRMDQTAVAIWYLDHKNKM